MLYDDFLTTVQSRLQQALGPDHHLELHRIPKNNGIVLDGLSNRCSGSPLAPTIYLNSYYEQMTAGKITLDQICLDIEKVFCSNPPPVSIHTDELNDFLKMKPRIMMKLIHAASNRKLLETVPYVPYLDLAIVFYLFLERSAQGQMTCLIHNDHLRSWNIDEQGLLSLAMQNTPINYPAEIRSISCVLFDIAMSALNETFDEPSIRESLQDEELNPSLYVLTNQLGIYGAACVLYPDVLKNFADKLGQDLLVIPSSVHEVLLAPMEEDTDIEEMNRIITAINCGEVAPEERLADHVYCYRRSQHRLIIPPVPAASL